MTGSPPDENGKTLVEFILTDVDKEALMLPTSLHPGDLEPPDPKSEYSVMQLDLGISQSKKPVVIFPGGADLYGSTSVPGTLIRLAPGESIHVLTKIALPTSNDKRGEEQRFVATGSLNTETVKNLNGRIVSYSQISGSHVLLSIRFRLCAVVANRTSP
jgi:hypothetical protein